MNERLLRGMLRLAVYRPRWVLSFWALLLIAMGPALGNLEISTSTDSVLDRYSESWDFYQASIRSFGGDEVLVVAIESDRPFDQAALERLAVLSATLEGLPGVRRVDSLATVPLIAARPDGTLELRAPLGDGVPASESELSLLRDRLRSDPLARGILLSEDGRVLALNLRLETDLGVHFDAVVEGVRRIVAEHGAWVSGVPVFRAEVNRRAGAEIAQFVALTLVVIALVLGVLLRSGTAIVVPLAVGGIGTWATLAALGATGTSLTLTTVILPSVMLALGCAYSMHLIAASRGAESAAELENALGPVLAPTALSGLSTAIGFLAIATVRIDLIREVGGFGALGVLVVVAATLSAVPAALVLKPLPAQPGALEKWCRASLSPRLHRLAVAKGRTTIVVSGALSVFFVVGLANVAVETDVARWFPHGSAVRDSYEAIRARLSGVSPINIVVESRDRPVTTPEILTAIDRLTRYLDGLPDVGRALSVADPLRQLHSHLVPGRTSPLPDSTEVIEQYLLLLGSAEYLDDLLTQDRTLATVRLRVDNNSSRDLLVLARQAESWWAEHGPPDTEARATGIMFEFARAEDEIAFGQLRGLALALAAVFGLMVAIYRSGRIAAIAMLPNIAPLVVVFGFLGLAGISLDAGTVISGCLVLGIAVDDTIHVVTAFVDEVSRGESGSVSLERALNRVLVPIVLSTVVISVGFAVLVLSEFALVRNLGALVVAVMGICLAADVLLLPPLLLRLIPTGARTRLGSRS